MRGALQICSALLLTLDPSATEIAFTLDATGHEVHGSFRLREGQVCFDPASGAASGTIDVDVPGAVTGNKRRDKTMHSKVLDSAAFPLFRFEPERFDGRIPDGEESEILVHGTMTVRGESHAMTLPMTLSLDGSHLSLKASFTIPYVEWGMKDPSFLFLRVAKVVAVEVTTTGRVSDVEAESDAER
jgi:polyisoprenoid-binding protein YceI